MPVQPYLTTTPWVSFTARERKRKAPLLRCPSAKCRRAKACIDAHDQLYCQRTHESVAEARARKGLTRGVAKVARPGLSPKALAAKIAANELLLEEARAETEAMIARWKSGEFDKLYGKFNAKGVWKHPPARDFVG